MQAPLRPLALCAALAAGCGVQYSHKELEPALSVSPDVVDFGVVPLGVEVSEQVVLANVGDGVLTLEKVWTDAPFSLAWDLPGLDPGASLVVPLAFLADEARGYNGSVSIVSDDPEQPLVQVPLIAVAVEADIAVDPAALAFEGDGPPVAAEVAVSNAGEGPLVVSGAALSDDGEGAFTLDDGEAFRLEPGEARALTVTWAGDRDAVGALAIRSNDPDSPTVSVALDARLCATWYEDADGDGYGDPETGALYCDGAPSGRTDVGDDCDDGDATTHPGAVEMRCDGTDQDCDGVATRDPKADWMLITLERDGAYEIDRETAALRLVMPLDGLDNPSTADGRADGLALVADVSSDAIWSLDLCAGTYTLIGETGVGDIGGMGFASDGELYGLDHDSDKLVHIDAATGAATVIGGIGFSFGYNGVAYDCQQDRLLGLDRYTNRLFTLDTATGLASDFVDLDVDFSVVGLEYEPASGLLLTSTGSGLYTINPLTGEDHFIGPLADVIANDLMLHPRCD